MEQHTTKKKRSLGAGLSDILSTVSQDADDFGLEQIKEELSFIPLNVISPNPYQPRKEIPEEELEELAASIEQHGVLQPVILRRKGKTYELIAGERRWRASGMANLTTIPAIIKEVTDEVSSAIALIENIQRENLNIMEEARAYARLQKDFELTHQQIADSVGKSRAAITNILRLMNLTEEVKELLEKHNLEMGHARALLALDDEQQIQAAKIVVSNTLSVRQTEQLVKKFQHDKGVAISSSNLEQPGVEIQNYLNEFLGDGIKFEQKPTGKGKITIKFDDLIELKEIVDQLNQLDLTTVHSE